MKTQTIQSLTFIAALIGVAANGCGKNAGGDQALPSPADTTAFRAASPDEGTLALDTSASENSSGTARDVGTAADVATDASSDVSDPSDVDPILADHPRLMLEAQNKGLVEKLNGALAPIVAEIKTMVATTPLPGNANSSANVHTWEATSASGKSTYKFIERKGTKGIGWLFEVKAASDPDVAASYKPVFAGRIIKALFADHRGEGIAGVDFDNQAVDGDTPLSPATGSVLLSFRHVNATDRALVYRTLSFSPDGTTPAVSAYFTGHRWHSLLLNANLLFIRAGGIEEVLPPATGSTDAGPETVHIRYRRVSGIGGWATALSFGGDVDSYSPPNTGDYVRIARVCWNLNAQNQETIAYRRVWQCALPYTPGTADDCTLLGDYSVNVTAGVATTTVNDPSDESMLTPIKDACFPDVANHTLLGEAAFKDMDGSAGLGVNLNASPDDETSAIADASVPAPNEDPPSGLPAGDASN